MDPIRTMELLPIPLTEDAKGGKLDQLIALNTELLKEREARYQENRNHTKRINQLQEDIGEMLENSAAQIEMREVAVLNYIDEAAGTIKRVRQDSKKMIEERALTDREREKYGLAPAEDEGDDAPAPKPRRRRGRPAAAAGEAHPADGEAPLEEGGIPDGEFDEVPDGPPTEEQAQANAT